MKKILLALCLVLCVGCQAKTSENSTHATSTQVQNYNKVLKTLKTSACDQKTYAKTLTCTLVYNKISTGYRYDLIFKQAQVKMYSVVAMAYSPESIDSYAPSLGIFDTDTYNMIPGYVDHDKGFYKGVALSGRTKKMDSIKCYISYYTDAKKTKKKILIFEVRYEN